MSADLIITGQEGIIMHLKSVYTHFLISVPFPSLPFHCSSGS